MRLGLKSAGGLAEAPLGAALLLLGGFLAAVVALRTGKAGPPRGYVAYGAAVLWALVGVAANQYDASLFTTGAAGVSAALAANFLLPKRVPCA